MPKSDKTYLRLVLIWIEFFELYFSQKSNICYLYPKSAKYKAIKRSRLVWVQLHIHGEIPQMQSAWQYSMKKESILTFCEALQLFFFFLFLFLFQKGLWPQEAARNCLCLIEQTKCYQDGMWYLAWQSFLYRVGKLFKKPCNFFWKVRKIMPHLDWNILRKKDYFSSWNIFLKNTLMSYDAYSIFSFIFVYIWNLNK